MDHNQPTVGLTEWDEQTVVDDGRSAADAPPAEKARLFAGRYLMLERIGEGGMGVVFAAWDTRLERRVALKMVRPERVRPATVQRLHREAQAMARLNHANVAVVHDVGEHEDRPYVAMEYVAGQDLKAWLNAEPRPWTDILEVYLDAAQGLDAAHEAGIIHRDFKPGNVLVGDDGRVRVTDFGLARAMGASVHDGDDVTRPGSAFDSGALDTTLTHEGALLGTPAYMSPEQVLEGRADPRSDQFAFCVSLFQSLYGVHPYAGVKAGPDMAAVAAGGPPEPPQNGRGVPAWLFQVLARGLQPVPDERFANMKAVREALLDDPGRRTKRRAFGVGLVLLLLLVGAAIPLARWSSQRELRNQGRDAETALLSPARRDALELRFTEVAGEPGRETARAVWGHLGRYVERWRSTWETCSRKRTSGVSSELQFNCLNRRMRTTQALVSLLEAANLALVTGAEEAVLALGPPEGCTDVVLHSGRVPRPTDAESLVRVEEIETMIDEGEAYQLAGEYSARLERLQKAAADAQDLGWQPLAAAGLVVLGTAEGDLGQLAAAEETLRRALSAAELGRDDTAACRAAIQLAWVTGVLDSRFADAERWHELAAAKIDRIGGDEELAAEVAMVNASVLREAGHYDQGLAEQRRALELVEQFYGYSSLQAAGAWHATGLILAERGDLEEAEQAYRRALDLKSSLLGSDHPGLAVTLSSLGDALVGQGRAAAGVVFARQAVEAHEAALAADHPELAKVLTSYGVALEENGQMDEALEIYSRAISVMSLAHGPDHVQVGYARLNLAILRHGMGRTSEAVEDAVGATRILTLELGEDHPHVAFAENNVGMLLHYVGRSKDAIPHLDRALELREDSNAEPKLVAQTRFNLGRATWSAGQTTRGRRLIRAAQRQAETIGEDAAALRTSVVDWLAEH